jgi:hypothetical protein
MVDAAVMVTCEKLGERKVATLDRRHFGTVRPRHTEHFEILPRQVEAFARLAAR